MALDLSGARYDLADNIGFLSLNPKMIDNSPLMLAGAHEGHSDPQVESAEHLVFRKPGLITYDSEDRIGPVPLKVNAGIKV